MQIGNKPNGVRVGEYGGENADSEKDQNAILGYVEPLCPGAQWIMWFTRKGDAVIYTEREETGAVKGQPIELKARP